jgi:hypothetical protein
MGHRRQLFVKFFLLATLLVGYFSYLSYEYGLLTGGMAALLSWSFFVLCTPIADAGFLLDFPLRLLFGIRMVVSEVVVWAIAITVNIVGFLFYQSAYETTVVTQLLHQIISEPFPYWGVAVLSAVGTFLSIHFGDELMDVIHHRDRDFFHKHHFKYELVLFAFFLSILFAYYKLIASLGIEALG